MTEIYTRAEPKGIEQAKEYLKALKFKEAMAYVQSLGIPKAEAEAHLEQWDHQKWTGLEFMIIKLSGGVLSDTLLEQIATLNKLGTYPMVVHGGGKQIDDLLAEKRIPTKKVKGQRVTDEETLKLVIKALKGVNYQIAEGIEKYGGNAVSIESYAHMCALYAKQLSKELKFVGEPIGLNSPVLVGTVKDGASPIIWSIGYGTANCEVPAHGLLMHPYNVNADYVPNALIKYIGSSKFAKLICITPPGGILDKDGQIISHIKASEIVQLIENGTITDGAVPKLLQAKELLQDKSLALDHRFKVQIVSPDKLLHEVLTHKGAGTEIVKA